MKGKVQLEYLVNFNEPVAVKTKGLILYSHIFIIVILLFKALNFDNISILICIK